MGLGLGLGLGQVRPRPRPRVASRACRLSPAQCELKSLGAAASTGGGVPALVGWHAG